MAHPETSESVAVVAFAPSPRCPFDPALELEDVRATQPVARFQFSDGNIGWLVTSLELARAVLGDPRFSRGASGSPHTSATRQASTVLDAIGDDPSFPTAAREAFSAYQAAGRLADAFWDPEVVRALHEHPLAKMPYSNMDAPLHSRMRRLLTGGFTVRSVERYRSRIEVIVDECLDAMEELGPPVDVVQTFALAIASRMTCELFGVPEADRARLNRLSAARVASDSTVSQILEVNEELRAFVREVVGLKRQRPGDDLISEYMQKEDMTETELISAIVLLQLASVLTTSNTLAYGVAALLRSRDQWDKLVDGSADFGEASEELLRYTSAARAAEIRTALEDVELAGVTIKACERVAVSLAAANRDPQAFVDPDRLDVTRHAARHLTFGHGVHQCLGQQLVRVVTQVALGRLVARFPTLSIASLDQDVAWPTGETDVWGPTAVRVTW